MSPSKKLTVRLKKSHADFSGLVNKRVGSRVAERRAIAGVTLAEMGMPMGVSMAQAQRYEAGVTALDVPGLLSVARTLNCRPVDLLVDFNGGDNAVPALSKKAVELAMAFDCLKNSKTQDALLTYVVQISELEAMRDAKA